MPSFSATATATRSATPPPLLKPLFLLLLACAATATLYYTHSLSSNSSSASNRDQGRQGGGAGAGTKRPYTPLDVVLEEGWVAHHHHNASDVSGVEEEEGWALRYVAVLARHGARYPTKRKLDLALEAAQRICSSTDSSTSPTGLREWCTTTIAALTTAEGAGLAPLGYLEHKLLGEHVAATYLTTVESVTVSLRAHVSSKRRTRESCLAFRDGAAGAWPNAWDALACEAVETESEGLLRPYEECPLLKTHRRAVVGAEEARGPEGVEQGIMDQARARVAQGLGLTAAEADTVDDDLVMGLFYACQTDLTLLAPHAEDGMEMPAHMAWIAATQHLGEGAEPAHSPVGPFSACALLPPELMEAMEGREDRENFHTRGYGLSATREVMAPFVRHVTARMAAAAAAQDGSGSKREVEVFFAHDTTLLPTVALLDLIRLDGADPGRSGAARSVPYASRLVLEAWARTSSSSSSASGSIDRIRLAYNGRVLTTLEGGLVEWKARYAAALAVRHEEICALEAESGAAEGEL